MTDPFFPPTRYQSGDLTIRPYQDGDEEARREATISSYEHLKPWMPWATETISFDEARTLTREFQAKYLLNEDFVMGIWLGDEFIGGTGFHLRVGPLAWGNAEIGMWIRASRSGQGLGQRVLRALMDWGFTEWGWDRLVWRCDTRNLASARLPEKLGWRLEGTFVQDHVEPDGSRSSTHTYAILREEWLATKPPVSL
jgi:RimJ/RimL family protein N-acetyltransferase